MHALLESGVLCSVATIVCYFAVTKLKPALGYDDALDTFGVHGVGGMVGAMGTGVVYSLALGGPGHVMAGAQVPISKQLVIQLATVGTTIVWATVGTTIAIYAAKALTGLRVSKEVEVEGLDINEHGERAYNY